MHDDLVWTARSGRARLLRRVRRTLRARDARRADRGARSASTSRRGRIPPSRRSYAAAARTTSAGRRRSGKRRRLAEARGGARIFLKREDLTHTGAHKINNALGQALLAKRMGKTRIVAETGAGQHGVASATACALLGLECVVYMGTEDMRRQALNVFRMRLLGAHGRRRRLRQPDAEGRDQRSDARLGGAARTTRTTCSARRSARIRIR